MALKNQYTTADYLEWDTAMNLIRRLYRDGKFRLSLLVGCGCFFGLRYSDIRQLRWQQVLSSECVLTLCEQKTGKRRIITINREFQKHIQDCYGALGIYDPNEYCFQSRAGGLLTIQAVNKQLKKIKASYGLRIQNFSTHSLRKTFGRRIVDMAGPNSEMALIRLSEIFQHASPMITRRYLGLRQQELGAIYESLQF